MEQETKYMKGLLPDDYVCEPRKNGVHCNSKIGIRGNGPDEHWELIVKAIKQKYGKRFLEIFHQTCTHHKRFTVYFKS
jgi:hypothetical protein